MEEEVLTELADLAFDEQTVWSELVLYGSILLKNYEAIYTLTQATEANNDRAITLLPVLFEESKKALVSRAYLTAGEYWPTERLPDVCGSCYHTFGLTVGGRYRFSCPLCKGQNTRLAFETLMAMHRLCLRGSINESILAQLIHKYYSPNGDKTWQMIKTTNLQQ